MINNEKMCSRCEEVRSLDLFAIYNGKPHSCCRLCQRASNRAYKKANPEKVRDQERARKHRNIEHSRAVQKAWRARNPEKRKQYEKSAYQRRKSYFAEWNRSRNLKKNYGVTIEQYDAMYRSQNGVCAVCSGLNLSGRRLAVDHDHATGKVRQLLCSRCNSSIGLAKESADILRRLAAYLEKHETLAELGLGAI